MTDLHPINTSEDTKENKTVPWLENYKKWDS